MRSRKAPPVSDDTITRYWTASLAGGLAAAFLLVGIVALVVAVIAVLCRLSFRHSVVPRTR